MVFTNQNLFQKNRKAKKRKILANNNRLFK